MSSLAAIETGVIFIGIFAVIIIGIVTYFVIRMMKGKVEIEIPKRGYNAGEEITGAVPPTQHPLSKETGLRCSIGHLVHLQPSSLHRTGADRRARSVTRVLRYGVYQAAVARFRRRAKGTQKPALEPFDVQALAR